MNREEVRSFYDDFGMREWTRLEHPADGALEFAITCNSLATHLPAGARVLDIGGGPGRYTLWLAERGHQVVLADLSPTLLDIARTKVAESPAAVHVEAIVEADACDLSRWPDGAFDAVLALGPFYHLTDPQDRHRAAAELARVIRPGGVAFVAFMSRYMFLRRVLAVPNERPQLMRPGFVERVLEEGVFVNEVAERFTEGYGARPDEIMPFLERHGMTSIALLATESIVPDLQEQLAELRHLDDTAYHTMLDVLIQVATDPSILGMSTHLLYVGRRSP